MSDHKLRWLGLGLVPSASAGLLALTAMMNSAFAYGAPLADPPFFPNPAVTLAEVMNGSGEPIPQESDGGQFLQFMFTKYLSPNFPSLNFASPCPGAPCDVNGLFTPEGFYPLTGVKDLPLDKSVSEGVTILGLQINNDLATLPQGDQLAVLGGSQSAEISSLEMTNLYNSDPTAPVNFVLLGDPMNPNGGLLERFVGLTVPSLGVTFYGATPANDFPTVIYTLEYDGFADFPRYPIDFPADLNAFLGIEEVHPTYDFLTPAQLATAFQLPTQGATDTTYYMIPTTDLPLLDPLRSIPVIGNPLADLLQPDLTYIVNLGYGDPLYGYSTAPANVPTPFGLFPPLSAFEQLPALLASGTQTGIQNFIGDFTGTGPDPVTLSLGSLQDPSSGTVSALADPLAALSAAPSDPGLSLTNIVNTLSSVASTAYATLLPTADLVNALLTTIPAYDVSLFVDSLQAGNLIDAIGLPIAADTALVTLVGGFEFAAIADAASTIIGSLGGLIP